MKPPHGSFGACGLLGSFPKSRNNLLFQKIHPNLESSLLKSAVFVVLTHIPPSCPAWKVSDPNLTMGWWGAPRLHSTGESLVEQILPGEKQRFCHSLPSSFPSHTSAIHFHCPLSLKLAFGGASVPGDTLSTYSIPSMVAGREAFSDPKRPLL